MLKNGTSWFHLVLLGLGGCAMFAVFLPIFADRPPRGAGSSCQSNLKQIGLGILQYTQDYDEYYPPTAVKQVARLKNPYGWADALQPYLKSTYLYHCPTRKEQVGDAREQLNPKLRDYTDYWFNGHISRAPLLSVTNARYALYALPQTWLDATDSPAHRHLDAMNLLFADGHVKAFASNTLKPDGPAGTTFNGLSKKP